ncbi:hypothetical protein CYY_000150 [Polysphondylium violaceum]|uniref:5-methyltetrahydropteroyltriglutamate--homocysteine S-methyltransferase n=1 Tax=Polysphondylium violaceum TaxID=133409 RepID=A0A8J4V2N1_9MYCE|nr:hypothetical protein CYY_000150 [Polysphondylium violaceum]
MTIIASNLGFPRMGENRELKKLVEAYWAGKVTDTELAEGIKVIRADHWNLQKNQGISHIPSNDFSLYDHVLDHIHLFGAIPARYQAVVESEVTENTAFRGWKTYFAMGRGYQTSKAASEASSATADTAFGLAASVSQKIDVGSMEMKKWFDTNYHYIVPEFTATQTFSLTNSGYSQPKPVQEFLEAKANGIETRPVILGPISFLLLGKSADSAHPYTSRFDALVHLEALLPVYTSLLTQLAQAGAQWIQIDEPILCLDLEYQGSLDTIKAAYTKAFTTIRAAIPSVNILLATYFGEIRSNIQAIINLPINAIHIDAVRTSETELSNIVNQISTTTLSLSIGVIDGRNIWKSNLKNKLAIIKNVVEKLGSSRVLVAPSCSLLHSPHSLNKEVAKVRPEVLDWLAFSVEKLQEVSFLTKAANSNTLVEPITFADAELQVYYAQNQESQAKRAVSPLIHNPAVKSRIESVTPDMFKRINPFPARRVAQRTRLTTLPALFPTTTIGSFPQTREVRLARSNFNAGKLSAADYDKFIREQIVNCVKIQEECGLDVLVHGEFERNDMVEYFGENLEGYVFTANGWVQSYGSRCVKPPIIFGDVSRPKPMTLEYTTYAQSLTTKPMKGMLTGPVTILQWSFVRDDIPRSTTCNQIALAIRDEVVDLEKAGIACIQIDEPAIREGLPMRASDWDAYLKWSVDSFLLSSTGVRDDTQIHSHMCYSDFNDIFTAIQRMDTDVLTIENSKSDLKLLKAFEKYGYTNEIGPGLYDIHSPRIPTIEDMKYRVEQMLKDLAKELIWVNPDCGLKTRGWSETIAALKNMVQVSVQLRSTFSN